MLAEQIAQYLTERFISDSKGLPDDECISEAAYILALVFSLVEKVANPYPEIPDATTGHRYVRGYFEQARLAILRELE